jgi:hypothetical protein
MTGGRIETRPPLPVGVHARSPLPALPFPLGEQGCRVYSRARHGLWQGLHRVGLRPGDGVLTPAYHHGSEVEALVRAGLDPRFYAGDGALRPDEDELRRLLAPGVRALYLVHYLGFPQDAAHWRGWCDEHGLLLLEDAAQAWLATVDGEPVGSHGDLSIFCLYKTFGLPDGGAVLVRSPELAPDGPAGAASTGAVALARRHAMWVLQRSTPLSALAGVARNGAAYDARADFELGDPDSAAAGLTMRLLDRVADPGAAARRRAHYAALLDELGDRTAPPFDRLPAGASPYAFPLDADDRPAVLRRLAAHGVAGTEFWSVPHPALEAARFPDAARRRARTVGLPVHQ